MAEGTIRQRVERAASSALERDQHVTAIDILTGLRWLSDSQVDLWRQGRVEYLLQEVQTNPDKVVTAMEFFVQWAKAKGLVPSEAAYVARTPDRRQLRFTPSSNPAVELVFCTHWLSPDLSDSKRAALIQAENSPPELVVVMPLRDFVCTGCGGSGAFLIMQDDGPLCLTCAQIDDLVFLPSGNAR
ncbi:MAG: DUF2293 domain-containing protein, partial [Actinomycetes bacterium]